MFSPRVTGPASSQCLTAQWSHCAWSDVLLIQHYLAWPTQSRVSWHACVCNYTNKDTVITVYYQKHQRRMSSIHDTGRTSEPPKFAKLYLSDGYYFKYLSTGCLSPLDDRGLDLNLNLGLMQPQCVLIGCSLYFCFIAAVVDNIMR